MPLLQRVKVLLKDGAQYAALSVQPSAPPIDAPILEVQLKEPQRYTRYLYALIKCFLMEGYVVYYPVDFRTFRKVSSYCQYLALLVKEEQVYFKAAPKGVAKKIVTEDSFSPAYFTPFLSGEENPYFKHIPMPMHPLMYWRGYWNAPVDSNFPRKQSVFMLGNFDPAHYKGLSKAFASIGRNEVYAYLQEEKLLYSVAGLEALKEFWEGEDDHKCIIVRSQDFTIPMERLRPTLSHFAFFLALPGTVMPHCHNVVEALSVGCIPIIHKEYANMLVPALEHGKNALLYHNKEGLKKQLAHAYQLPPKQVQAMNAAALEYYQTYLTPKAVVALVEQQNFDQLWLMAEHESVKFL